VRFDRKNASLDEFGASEGACATHRAIEMRRHCLPVARATRSGEPSSKRIS